VKRLLISSSVVLLLLGLIGTTSAFNVTPINPPLPESSIEATLVFMGGEPGNEVYRYDFHVRNISIQPAVQTVLVFFDSDPVTGEFLGDKSDLVEIQSPPNWESYGWVDPDPAPWFVEWQTFSGPDRIFPGQTKVGFSVTFVWKDPETTPGQRFFEAMNGAVYEGQTIIVGQVDESVSICGTVHNECETAGLPPLTVDLHNEADALVATTTTDETGSYCFVDQLAGQYTVSIVTPLGFILDAESKTVVVDPGTQAQVDFIIDCLDIEPSQRTIGYWKHQANALVMGKGKSQEGLDNMISYIHAVREHFNEHVYNPVIVFEVELDPEYATAADSLLAIRQILTVNKGGTMLDRAKQQMVALLLNVASLKLSQTEIISEDGANVSQAITYCNEIITDQAPGIPYEVAKDIADIINNGGTVPAGVIPLDTEIIWYSLGSRDLAQIIRIHPNPFASTVSIRYTVPETGTVRGVGLEVYDIRGRVVYRLGNLAVTPGEHQIVWEGVDHFGRKVASGAYFVNVKSDGGISTRKVMLIRSR
jgi:hypothetical protein